MKINKKLSVLCLSGAILFSTSVAAFANNISSNIGVEENKDYTLYNTAIFEGGQSSDFSNRAGEKISSEVSLEHFDYPVLSWYSTGWVNVVDKQYLPIEHYTNATVESESSWNYGTIYAQSGRVWGNGKVYATSDDTTNWG